MVAIPQTTFGEAFVKFGRDFPAERQLFEFGVGFWELSERLVAEGRITPHPVTMRDGGLRAIPDG